MKKKYNKNRNNFALMLILLLSVPVIFTGALKVANASQKPVKYRVKVVASYPHNTSSFTQGLFFHNRELYETTGQYGSSKFLKIDIKTGKPLITATFPEKYFAEGSTIINGKAFILSWMERVAFVYDITTFKPLKTLFNPREGWGLTTDGKELIMSDGSDIIYFIDPEFFKEKRTINVTLEGRKVTQLNELEYIKGEIWANVFGDDNIYIIDPDSGKVKGIVECKDLMPQWQRNSEMVLNGIAFEPESGKIYITGKLWPRLYQVELIKK